MTELVRSFLMEESAATAVEYGLMVALIALAIIGTVALLGGSLSGMFDDARLKAALGR